MYALKPEIGLTRARFINSCMVYIYNSALISLSENFNAFGLAKLWIHFQNLFNLQHIYHLLARIYLVRYMMFSFWFRTFYVGYWQWTHDPFLWVSFFSCIWYPILVNFPNFHPIYYCQIIYRAQCFYGVLAMKNWWLHLKSIYIAPNLSVVTGLIYMYLKSGGKK